MSQKSKEQLSSEARALLDEVLSRKEPLKPKDRMAIPAQEMPAQDPGVRRKNVTEVALGYTPEQAGWRRCAACSARICRVSKDARCGSTSRRL